MAATYVKENKCGAPKADACPINLKFCRPNGSWVNGLANWQGDIALRFGLDEKTDMPFQYNRCRKNLYQKCC